MSKGLIITLGVIAAIVIGGLSFYGKINSEYNAGMAQEVSLSRRYQDNQVQLDTATKKIVESVGLANLKSDKLRQIISEAVKGRYEGKMQPGTGGAMFSAISEAYPQIDLSIYDKIVDLVNAEREAFKGAQSILLDELRSYETWKATGIIRQFFVAKYFPSTNLKARVGSRVVTGAAALEQMHLIVLSQGTEDAFNNGKQEPIDFNKR